MNRFGPQVAEDVSREIINESFPKALEELKTFPLGTPLLDKEPLEDGKPFTYSAEMEVRPEVDLKEYVGVEVEKEKFAITDDDVEKRLENIRKANGKLVSLEEERALQSGDMALIDYQAYEDEKALEEMHAENFLIELGSGDFHPSFEKALEGLNKQIQKETSFCCSSCGYESEAPLWRCPECRSWNSFLG